jgi:hypothetical protein
MARVKPIVFSGISVSGKESMSKKKRGLAKDTNKLSEVTILLKIPHVGYFPHKAV